MIYEDINHVNDCSDLRNDEAIGEIYIPLSFFVVKCTFGRLLFFFILSLLQNRSDVLKF